MTYYTPSLSVICASYNRPNAILRLLGLLNDQRCINFNGLDVCIVEDGSERRVESWPETKYELIHIYRDRDPQGLAHVYSSRNMAAEQTHGEFILQVDDDVEFHPYLINMLQSMAGMAAEEHWVWTPRISNNTTHDSAGKPNNGHHASCNWDFGPDGRWWDGRVAWQESHWGSADSSGMFMPRRTWEAVGGYDLNMDGTMGFGDQLLALKIQKLGAKPGDVKLWIAPYFVNKADEETGSHRMNMIHLAAKMGRKTDNWEYMKQKHPDLMEWQNV